MENILLILPDDWVIKKIRYVQIPTGGATFLLNADEVDSPLDNPGSILNYPAYTIKRNGPTGFQGILDNTEGIDRGRQIREDPPEWMRDVPTN